MALALACAGLRAAAQAAQEPPSATQAPSRPGADPELVILYATVVNDSGNYVASLREDNFTIMEDKVEQKLSLFRLEDAPMSIGVILDVSGSMLNKIDKSRLAVLQFLRAANPHGEYFLVTFNGHAELSNPFTNSVDDIKSRMEFVEAKGLTALLDAIYLGLSQMRVARNQKKAMLLISDGGDNHSRYSEQEVRKFVRETDTQIYAIAPQNPPGSPLTPEDLDGAYLLEELTKMSGGGTFVVANLSDLPAMAVRIGMALRNQYVLGYRPSNRARDGKWRKINVKLRLPKGSPHLNVYAKSGYYSPR